jgi:hypothetical protein
MAVLFDIKVQGGFELDRQLQKMDRKVAGNLIRRAVRHSLLPVQAKIRQRVKSDLNAMNAQARAVYSKQIGISVNVVRGGVRGRIRTKSTKVKASKGIRNFARWAHIFEGGTKPHTIVQPKRKRVIKHPGIKSDPIWAESFDAMQQRLGQEYRDYIFNEIFKR